MPRGKSASPTKSGSGSCPMSPWLRQAQPSRAGARRSSTDRAQPSPRRTTQRHPRHRRTTPRPCESSSTPTNKDSLQPHKTRRRWTDPFAWSPAPAATPEPVSDGKSMLPSYPLRGRLRERGASSPRGVGSPADPQLPHRPPRLARPSWAQQIWATTVPVPACPGLGAYPESVLTTTSWTVSPAIVEPDLLMVLETITAM